MRWLYPFNDYKLNCKNVYIYIIYDPFECVTWKQSLLPSIEHWANC